MKMLFSRWNSAPPSRDGRPLFQPFSWKSHAPSQRRSRRSPRYSLFTLSKIKNRLEPIGSTQNIASPDRCSVPRSAPGRSRGSPRQELGSATAAAADTNDALRRSVGGGGERNRTDDLLLAKQALSQLSYTPRSSGGPPPEDLGGVSSCAPELLSRGTARAAPRRIKYQATNSMPRPCLQPFLHQAALDVTGVAPAAARDHARSAWRVVGQGGFEPPTSRLSSARSNQLSY